MARHEGLRLVQVDTLELRNHVVVAVHFWCLNRGLETRPGKRMRELHLGTFRRRSREVDWHFLDRRVDFGLHAELLYRLTGGVKRRVRLSAGLAAERRLRGLLHFQ